MVLTNPEFQYIINIVKNVKPLRVLECGCNSGSELIRLVGLSQELYGIDIDAKKIELARLNVPTGKFAICGADQLPYENDFFDIVFSTGGILAKTPPDKCADIISEMLRVTRGRLILFEYVGSRQSPDPQVYTNAHIGSYLHDFDAMLIGFDNDVEVSKFVVVGYDRFALLVLRKGLLDVHHVISIEPKVDELNKMINKEVLPQLEALRVQTKKLVEIATAPRLGRFERLRKWLDI
jgi:SAM-dependent methyltransferase